LSEKKKNIARGMTEREKRVLLVLDNNAHDLCYLSVLLERLDYHVYTAMTAAEALEALTVIVPSLIITSLTIKDMDSLELMRMLKRSPVVGAVPFITLIKRGNEFAKARSLNAGAVDCIERPISPEQLYRAVEAIVGATPRTDIRIRTHQPVKVHDTEYDDFYGAYTLNLSERGMFLRTVNPVSEQRRLSCQIHMYGRIVEVDAAVLYSNWTSGGAGDEQGMGLRFVRIASNDRELLRWFIRSEVVRGITLESV
jgi:CheY-like chemotaxis protein